MRSTIFMIHGMWAVPFVTGRRYRCIASALGYHDAPVYDGLVWESGRIACETGFLFRDLHRSCTPPHSTCSEFPGSGHWPIAEPGWPGTAGAVAGWLGTLEPAVPRQGPSREAPAP